MSSGSVVVTQSCPTPCNPLAYSLSLLCPRDSSGKNTGVGCYFLPQSIFLTQGSNLGLLQILYHLSHQGNLCNHYLSLMND